MIMTVSAFQECQALHKHCTGTDSLNAHGTLKNEAGPALSLCQHEHMQQHRGQATELGAVDPNRVPGTQ